MDSYRQGEIEGNNEYQQWLQHYWWLGSDIISKQKEQGWGAKVIDQLSVDLQKRYGSDSGYSIRNLKYMCQFADEYPDFPFVQVPLAQITWYHHISMLPKIKDLTLRAFFMTEASIQGWSRVGNIKLGYFTSPSDSVRGMDQRKGYR